MLFCLMLVINTDDTDENDGNSDKDGYDQA